MTVATTEQGPQKRYRRLRFPSFDADVWANKNPLLQKGELGHEKDTGRFKVGDGVTYWLDLPYNSVGDPAKVNGYSVLEIVAGKNVEIEQSGNVLTIGASGVGYSKQEIDDKFTVANAQIDANAIAIQKTRDDYMSADTDIMTIVNNHAEELTTLRGNQASLGNQVAGIEGKIPESASGTNHLITKQQLLDEEKDIRKDLNSGLSELQTQVTAQAAEIATKQDKLIAGDNIVIGSDGKTISATGAGGGAGLSFIVYDALPETGESGIIYLVPKDGEAPDIYDEYVWITATSTFELIGSTQVDLTDYAKKEYVDNAISGFEALPDQSGNSGKFLITNGTTASWSDKPLVNNAEFINQLAIGKYAEVKGYGVAVGYGSAVSKKYDLGLALGLGQVASANGAIQIGCGASWTSTVTNSDANTFKVANANGNFEIMSADGTIPADRMSATAGTTGQVLTKTDTGMEWQEASGGTTITLKEYDE